MSYLNKVEPEHIARLNPQQLVDLLLRLLNLEAVKYGLPLSDINIPLNINSPDGGEDGRVKWEENNTDWVLNRDWIPNKYTVFQCKAKDLGKKESGDEILNSAKDSIKPKVKEVFDANGAYILFCNHPYVQNEIDVRINSIRENLKKFNIDNYENLTIEFYDANKIANWVNSFFQTVNFISELNSGFSLPYGFKTWKILNQYEDFQDEFFSNDKLDSYINSLRELSISERKIIRILGLAGLGKTRLIAESFKYDNNNLKQKILSDTLIYYDSYNNDNVVLNYLINLINKGLKGTIVIDNCSIDLHQRLSSEILRIDSKLNLITIDYFQTFFGASANTIYFELTNNDYESVVSNMLDKNFPKILPSDKERIRIFCQGFPLLAHKLAKQLDSGYDNIGTISDESLVKKIIWGNENFDNEEIIVLCACSIFDKIGFYDELLNQREFIARNKSICNLNYDDSASNRKFYETCNKFLRKGILERRGRYILMKPKPLAITLAAKWWEQFPPEEFDNLIIDLAKTGLNQPLCEQFSYLNFLPKAKDLVKDLCKENAPFGQAEVLNSQEGSRLFRSLAIVNPEAATDNLYRLFINYSKEELLKIDKGRRELVWTLELLCWRKETFEKAVKVLLAFAVSENETWANNATGIFSHLFQTRLPGTEASLQERLGILRFALSKNNDGYNVLVLKALKSALITQYFTRSSGFEKQGSTKTLNDYRATWGEVKEYWAECIDILKKFILNDNSDSDLAEELFTHSFRGLISLRLDKLILPVIKEIAEIKDYKWDKALSGLKLTLRFESINLDHSTIEEISALIEQLTPKDFRHKYEIYVNRPSWEVNRDQNNKYSDIWKINSENVAIDLYKNSNWKEYLDIFFIYKQLQGYNFSYKFASLINNKEEAFEFIDFSLKYIENFKREEINVIVLIGFINGLKDFKYIEYVFESLVKNEKLLKYTINIMRSLDINYEIFKRILILFQLGKFQVHEFNSFAYNNKFLKFSVTEMTEIISELRKNESDGIWTSINLLYRYQEENLDKWFEIVPLIKETVSNDKLLVNKNSYSQLEDYYWEELIKKILLQDTDIVFAQRITKQIVSFCMQTEFNYGMEQYVQNILEILLDKFFVNIWPIIGNAILKNTMAYWHIVGMIGFKIEFDDAYEEGFKKHVREKNGILFKGNSQALLNWCDENKPHAPIKIARMLPIMNKDIQNEWHPFTKIFIEKFGSDNKVLSEITANMSTYSWSGSLVPLLKEELELYKHYENSENNIVQNWAIDNIERLKKWIKNEKNEDEERYL